MVLVLEQGQGAFDAQSYVSLEAAQAFIEARGHGVELTEGLLVRAMDVLESLHFVGITAVAGQALEWPRAEAVDIFGNELDEDLIPEPLIRAQIWLAFHIANGHDPDAVEAPAVRDETTGDAVSFSYAVRDGETERYNVLRLPHIGATLTSLLIASPPRELLRA